MKKITIILSLIVLVLLVVEGLYFFKTLTKPEVPITQSIQVKEKPLQIVLYRESGDVSYKRPTDSAFQSLSSPSIEIPNLTSVRTTTGKGTVLLPDNSVISLSDNTEISVNYTDKATSIFQSLGTTYHRVEALVSGRTYEVQTQGTLAAVRGTKFAVSYDKLKSTTKIAVTEHKVSVARIKKSFEPNATTTEIKLEEVMVGEGDTAKISEATTTTKTPGKPGETSTPPSLVVGKTDDDKEIKTWIIENQAKDPIIDKLKTDNGDKKEYRKELEKMLNDDSTKVDDNSTGKDTTATDAKPTDTTKPADTKPTDAKPVTDVTKKPVDTKPDTTTKPVTTVPAVKKIAEDVFFDEFNNVFVKDFYVEDDDGICSSSMSTQARVKEVSDYATKSGYPLPAGTAESLAKFGDDIQYYCKNGKGDAKARSVLQGRFDDEFPFKESI